MTRKRQNRNGGRPDRSENPARPRCGNPGCGRPADDSWGRAQNLCPDCALGLELFDRGERRERIFAGN